MAASTLRIVSLAYGLFCFVALGVRAIWEGYVAKRPDRLFWKSVEKVREDYWTLSKRPDGLDHVFYRLNNGRQLHYVTTSTPDAQNDAQPQGLVILLHGWPDSWILWRKAIRSSLASSKNARFVALDLPGFGGSDALDKHDATGVLEAVTEFILAMRDRYLDGEERAKVLVVGHDWGALVGFKLAAQAPELADRFILINSTLPELASENVGRRLSFVKQMLPKWFAQPKRLSLLRSISATISPVFHQLVKSSYVFIFNLPAPLPSLFGRLGQQWFIRYAHFLASGRSNAANSPEAVLHMASSLGPSESCCSFSTPNGSEGYGLTVAKRAGSGTWFNSIRYYSEGLTFQRWDKSVETMSALHNLHAKSRRSSSSGGIFDFEEKPGRLLVPATILWGDKDPALSSTIMLEGIKDYFVRGSQVVNLPSLGHWVPLENGGPEAIAEVVKWALGGEKGTLEEPLQAVEVAFKITVSK